MTGTNEHTRPGRRGFDPFGDRRARDIRNSLSTSLVASLTAGDPALTEAAAGPWLAAAPAPAYRSYILNRLERYRAALEEIRRRGVQDPVRRSIVLWNHGLLFETHELLEPAWQAADGGRREALKGLIQAAGVFVHLEQGNHRAARGLAQRAGNNLRRHARHLAAISNLEELVVALERRPSDPPRLVASGTSPDLERRAP